MAYQQHTKPDINITAAPKSSGAASREAIAIVRDLIDHILVTPTPRPDPVDLTVVGNLAALTQCQRNLRLAQVTPDCG